VKRDLIEFQVQSPTYDTSLDSSKTYIVIGGLGGIGSSLSTWMFSRGARRFVLMGRSNPAHSKNKAVVTHLKSLGASVNIEHGDITRFDDIRRIISEIDGTIGGVVHAAMGLSVRFPCSMFYD
jgi:NAD(P)-dependent dehydrogenase (short-subunit alcohol dehydrogenase family)